MSSKKERIKDNDLILLIGKEKSFIVNKSLIKFHSKFGMLNLKKIKHYGEAAKTNIGHVFIAAKPTIIDLLRKCRRMPQIIMPKDAAQIAAVTGVSNGWQCMDAGGGSGFLSIFIGNLVKPDGHIYTYEKNKQFAENIKKNVKYCNLEKIVSVTNSDAKKFREKELDLITLDMMGAENMVKKAYKALKPGRWLCVYSPHIEQQKLVREEMEKSKFINIHTIENIQRYWQVNSLKGGYTHPKPSGIMHTGFLTFGRKI